MVRYAVADLHGQLDLLNQIKEYINETDILYVLGDSGDRGPEPWRTLKACLDDSQIVYIIGNHDLMLINAIEQYRKIIAKHGECRLFDYIYSSGPIHQLSINGGIPTLEGWIGERQEKQIEYYNKLKALPLEIRLGAEDGRNFIYLNHSGAHPGAIGVESVEDFVWDRKHFYLDWDSGGDVLFHGHTPTQAIAHKLAKDAYTLDQDCMFYNDGCKIDIDVGACFYNKAALINIDTHEIKTFYTGENVDGAQGK